MNTEWRLWPPGHRPLKPDEYSYGKDPRILTSLELDRKFMDKDPGLKKINTAVFIQCVGSREPERPYCSRVCCTHSVDNALQLKKLNPDMNVFVLYRDIRTYGEREYIYKEAREAGVIFIRYSLDDKPEVTIKDGQTSGQYHGSTSSAGRWKLKPICSPWPRRLFPTGMINWPIFSKFRSMRMVSLWSAMPSSGRLNLLPTVFFFAVWPTIPNPLMNPSPRARRPPPGPSPCWHEKRSIPAEQLPKQIRPCAVNAAYVCRFARIRHPHLRRKAPGPAKPRSIRSCARGAAYVWHPAARVPFI